MMSPQGREGLLRANARRRFLIQGLEGAGLFALSSLLGQDGLRAQPSDASPPEGHDPNQPRPPHFPAKAKRIIYIYLEGGPSQMDLFDPKPELNRLHGEPLPASQVADVSFAFLKKESARLMGSPRTFTRYGQCGMELSDLLPRLGECADDLCLIRSLTPAGLVRFSTGGPSLRNCVPA